MLHGLLLGLVAFVAANAAHAQVQHIDFQVLHLPRIAGLPDEHYVAIRTEEAWVALWSSNYKDPNAAPIRKIDFKRFTLLIAQTGVKPSSGYSIVLTSVDAFRLR